MHLKKWVREELRERYKSPSLAPRTVCRSHREGEKLDRQMTGRSASMLVTIARMEVNAGMRPAPGDEALELGPGWESHPKPTRKRIKGDLPITGTSMWAAAYPRDSANPKRGCLPGSEDQACHSCDACNGEHRPGFVCLRCLPGGPERAHERERAHKARLKAEEKAAARRRVGRRFVRAEVMVGCGDD